MHRPLEDFTVALDRTDVAYSNLESFVDDPGWSTDTISVELTGQGAKLWISSTDDTASWLGNRVDSDISAGTYTLLGKNWAADVNLSDDVDGQLKEDALIRMAEELPASLWAFR